MQRPEWLGMLLVASLFCAPLFLGLAAEDLGNDEAIYSFAVDTILDRGAWMTPGAIPSGEPFLEKPPLKFWMVAGAIRSGLLPRDERGFRALDALFGAAAFLYVFWLGRRLAGTICGVTAVLVLFTFQPLLFEHGLRSNNMEAALVLSYCGGVYHFVRWLEARSAGGTPRAHAMTVAAYITLGFMTKFVAVFFLPLVCLLAFLWRRDAPRQIGWWRDWIVPALAAVAVAAPWFVYQAVHAGAELWDTMVGVHVYQRFTDALDPGHLQPWHYYYSAGWDELSRAGTQWLAAAGLLLLMVRAWRGRPWTARIVFLWWLVPVALISLGTSKILHYAYPFLPPLALAAGAAAAALFHLAERAIPAAASRIAASFRIPAPAFARGLDAGLPRPVRHLLLAAALGAIGLGVWTAAAGTIRWEIGGVEILRNSNVIRPVAFAAVFLIAGSQARTLGRLAALVTLALFLPLGAYGATIERTTRIAHPLRTLRDCALAARLGPFETHVYPGYEALASHTYYYYLRDLGPWVEHERAPGRDELERRLASPGGSGLMVMYEADYARLVEGRRTPAPGGLRLLADVVLLTPASLDGCTAAAVSAGGIPFGGPQL